MIKNNWKKFVFVYLGGFVISFLIVFNVQINNEFLLLNFYDLFTLIWMVVVSYYIVEKKSDDRILKEKVEETINVINIEIQKIDISFFENMSDVTQYTMLARRISNKINILENYNDKFNIEEETQYIKKSFIKIDDTIGDNLILLNKINGTDDEQRRRIVREINNQKGQIETRLDKIFLKMYK